METREEAETTTPQSTPNRKKNETETKKEEHDNGK
jgi:hypothetical protein